MIRDCSNPGSSTWCAEIDLPRNQHIQNKIRGIDPDCFHIDPCIFEISLFNSKVQWQSLGNWKIGNLHVGTFRRFLVFGCSSITSAGGEQYYCDNDCDPGMFHLSSSVVI